MFAHLPDRARWPLTLLAVAVVYYIAARCGLLLAFETTNASPVWPPSGIALAAILLLGYHAWPGIAFGALVANVVVFTANQVADPPTIVVVAFSIAIGNTLEALLGVFFLRRLVGARSPFDQPQDVFKFVLVALLTCVVAAAVGTASLLLGGIAPRAALTTIWLTWWLGDAAGILIVSPVLFTWLKRPSFRWQSRLALEVVGSAALLIAIGAAVFGEHFPAQGADRLLIYLFIPCLAWAAFRYGPKGVATASLLVTGMAVWGTTHGHGPFAKGNLNDSLIVLDTFVGLCSVIGLVLAADRIERRRLQRASAMGRDIAVPWLVLLGCLGITVVGWHLVASHTERQARERFDLLADGIKSRIGERMLAYEEILRGAVGLFAAARSVQRHDWRDYVQRLRLEQNYPGLQGVAYAQRVSPADKDAHVRQIRGEGFPDYAIWPAGERGEYTSIIYIEPFNDRNRRAFGYDMFSEPVRRAAMVRARDTGDAAITDKVTLVQETGEDVQPGFLMYLPVYRNGARTETLEERRTALAGFVYSPFRMNDLMQIILSAEPSDLSLRIFDGAGKGAHSLMYDREAPHRPNDQSHRALFFSQTALTVGEHLWTLRFTSMPAFEDAIDRQKAQIILIAGIVISLLLFIVVRSLAITRENALLLANDMTAAFGESEARFRSLAESANEAFIVADVAGTIISWNRGAQATFGYTTEEITGKQLTQLMPERYREPHLQGLARMQTTGAARVIGKTVELSGLTKDGHEFPLELSLATWKSGTARFYSGIIRDITERKRFEETLQEQNVELANANQAKDRFLASMSHELRTPLNAIIGFTGTLLMKLPGPLTHDQETQLRTVQTSARHLLALIKDLLDVAKIGAGKMELNIEPTDCNKVVEEVAAFLRPATENKGLVLAVNMPAGPVMLRTDQRALKQIVINLASNAIKFTEQGSVSITMTKQKVKGQAAIAVSVEDTGVGIPSEEQAKLFTAFSRVSVARGQAREGTGLGLHLSQKLAELLGGRIGLHSEYGKGSTFTLVLPEL